MSTPSEWAAADPGRARRLLGRVRQFRQLPDAMLDAAAADLTEVRFVRGERLATRGKRREQALFVVVSGRVRLLDVDEEGSRRILGYLGPGDVFGLLELLTGGPSRATAEAVLDTVTMALPHRAFHQLLADFPSAALPLARQLGRRMRAGFRGPGRRRTSVFLGVHAPAAGPLATLTVLAVARALSEVTASAVLVLDFEAAGPGPSASGPGLVRSMTEVLDARGEVDRSLLARHVLHSDDALSLVQFRVPARELDDLDPGVFPALLGEAKQLTSYVLVHVPSQLGQAASKLLGQMDRVLLALEPSQVGADWALPAEVDPRRCMVGLVDAGAGAADGLRRAADLLRVSSKRRVGFRFEFPERAVRAVQRLRAFPRDLLDDDGPVMRSARALARRVTRRRLGICLGSGTALGWAHIGVLEVLDREGIPFDCLAGSSMGSLIAALRASGWSVAQLRDFARGCDKPLLDSLTDYNWPVLRDGILRGDKLLDFLREIYEDRNIEDLPVPLVIQTTDLGRGRPHLFTEGPVAEAVRASVSLPGIFRMVRWQDRYLVDGGVHDTLPVEPLRELGGDLVLAVNTTQDPRMSEGEAGDLGEYNLVDVFMRSLEVMQTRRSGFEGRQADLMLQPVIRGVNWRELWRADELVEFGVEAAEKALDKIRALLRRPPV